MGVVGGGFRNVCLKSLAAACSLPIPSSSSSSQSSPPNGASRRSAQIGGGLRVVLRTGESVLLLAVGGMLACDFYMLLLPLSISRSADGAEI